MGHGAVGPSLPRTDSSVPCAPPRLLSLATAVTVTAVREGVLIRDEGADLEGGVRAL